ncbi:MAG: hypothetical protein EOO65_02145, partial [Methanosarcinales archaeon]
MQTGETDNANACPVMDARLGGFYCTDMIEADPAFSFIVATIAPPTNPAPDCCELRSLGQALQPLKLPSPPLQMPGAANQALAVHVDMAAATECAAGESMMRFSVQAPCLLQVTWSHFFVARILKFLTNLTSPSRPALGSDVVVPLVATGDASPVAPMLLEVDLFGVRVVAARPYAHSILASLSVHKLYVKYEQSSQLPPGRLEHPQQRAVLRVRAIQMDWLQDRIDMDSKLPMLLYGQPSGAPSAVDTMLVAATVATLPALELGSFPANVTWESAVGAMQATDSGVEKNGATAALSVHANDVLFLTMDANRLTTLSSFLQLDVLSSFSSAPATSNHSSSSSSSSNSAHTQEPPLLNASLSGVRVIMPVHEHSLDALVTHVNGIVLSAGDADGGRIVPDRDAPGVDAMVYAITVDSIKALFTGDVRAPVHADACCLLSVHETTRLSFSQPADGRAAAVTAAAAAAAAAAELEASLGVIALSLDPRQHAHLLSLGDYLSRGAAEHAHSHKRAMCALAVPYVVRCTPPTHTLTTSQCSQCSRTFGLTLPAKECLVCSRYYCMRCMGGWVLAEETGDVLPSCLGCVQQLSSAIATDNCFAALDAVFAANQMTDCEPVAHSIVTGPTGTEAASLQLRVSIAGVRGTMQLDEAPDCSAEVILSIACDSISVRANHGADAGTSLACTVQRCVVSHPGTSFGTHTPRDTAVTIVAFNEQWCGGSASSSGEQRMGSQLSIEYSQTLAGEESALALVLTGCDIFPAPMLVAPLQQFFATVTAHSERDAAIRQAQAAVEVSTTLAPAVASDGATAATFVMSGAADTLSSQPAQFMVCARRQVTRS